METRWGKVRRSTKQASAGRVPGWQTFERTDYFLFDGRRATRWPLSRWIKCLWLGARKAGTAMKYAFESVLTAATLAMFAVFLAWSAKIIVGWT
jgi:hypothetical protein